MNTKRLGKVGNKEKWLDEIAENIYVTKLKYYCNVKDGTHDTPEYINQSEENYPLVTSKDIKNGNIDFSDVKYISKKDMLNINKRSNVEENDIIMPMIGTIGNPAIVQTNKQFSVKNVALFKTSDSSIKARYLKYVLLSDVVLKQFEVLNRGGVQSFVSLNVLRNLLITRSENEEKIVHYLDLKCSEINSLIDDKERLIILLEAQRKAIITEAVTKGLNPDINMKDSGVEWIGELPEHWIITKIKHKFTIQKRIISQENPTVLSLTQKGLKIKDLEDFSGQHAESYSNYQLVNKDDFVMNSMDLLTGFVDCSPYIGVTSPDYRVFTQRNLEECHLYYLYYFQMCYFEKIFYGHGQGVSKLGRWRLQTDVFKEFPIMVPPVEEQFEIARTISEKTNSINEIIQMNRELIDKLKEYCQSLIFQAVTGKIDVRDFVAEAVTNV
ncbi:restriction endonuclease subunit S [Paenibacillus sp. FSL L8-0499]|uniref:restriction endonuclease subunit S n=1 Tax=Paenibacillus sp. FSL L8-0499 TaxID=2975334 RepID=UPI0030FC8EB4